MRTFMDTLHGITAPAKSKTRAWMLIRNEYHTRGIQVPQINQITEIYLDDEHQKDIDRMSKNWNSGNGFI